MSAWYDKILDHILNGPNFLGLVCYIIGSSNFLWIQIHFAREVVEGLKGENGKWESPEWMVYLASWLFPQMIMASGFLAIPFPDWSWYTMWILIIFGLTGRWGLEWLLAFKNNTTVVQQTKIEQTTTTTNPPPDEPK